MRYLLIYTITEKNKDGHDKSTMNYDWFRDKEELADAIIDLRIRTKYPSSNLKINEMLDIESYDDLYEEDVIEDCAEGLKEALFEDDEDDTETAWEELMSEIYPQKVGR